jgi:ketosteroid isomerase-like protein
MENTGNTDIDDPRARRFADALQGFEQSSDPTELAALFSGEATLSRLDARGDRDDPEAFWREYRAQFDQLSTTFTHATESGDRVALEWSSTGTLTNGRSIEYRGVTVVDFDGDEIARLRTYYDTAAFTAIPASTA